MHTSGFFLSKLLLSSCAVFGFQDDLFLSILCMECKLWDILKRLGKEFEREILEISWVSSTLYMMEFFWSIVWNLENLAVFVGTYDSYEVCTERLI